MTKQPSIILRYKLNEIDYLNLQLYYASSDGAMLKQRKQGRWIVTLLLLVIGGLVIFMAKDYFYGGYFIIASVAAYFIYPLYTKWFYKRLFRRNIHRHYKDIVPVNMTLEIDGKIIDVKDTQGHGKFETESLESIAETKEYFFIKMGRVAFVIIPKDQISYVGSFREDMKELCKEEGRPFISDIEWVWS